MPNPDGTVQVQPTALMATSDAVRESADVIGSVAIPVVVQVAVVDEMAQLQERLASFEAARSGHDAKVFESFRSAAEFLAVMGLNTLTADNAVFLSLPDAGW